MPVTVLMHIMPSHEFAEWKAWTRIRHEEFEAEKAKSASKSGMRTRGGTATMGAKR